MKSNQKQTRIQRFCPSNGKLPGSVESVDASDSTANSVDSLETKRRPSRSPRPTESLRFSPMTHPMKLVSDLPAFGCFWVCFSMVDVGKYTSLIDPMGNDKGVKSSPKCIIFRFHCHSQRVIKKKHTSCLTSKICSVCFFTKSGCLNLPTAMFSRTWTKKLYCQGVFLYMTEFHFEGTSF